MSDNKYRNNKKNSPANNSIEVKSRYISFLQRRRVGLTEWAVHSENNLTNKLAHKRARLDRMINRARRRTELKVARREHSTIYKKSHVLYNILLPVFTIGRFLKCLVAIVHHKTTKVRQLSPHRTLFITDPTLARRSIKMPGYIGFSTEVMRLIWNNKRLFVKYILVIGAIVLFIVGGLSQHNLRELRDGLENNGVGGWNEWSALFAQAISRASTAPDASQQVILGLMLFYSWMIAVWLCRKINNGKTKLALRDGLYNSGSPLFGELALIAIMLAQAIPLAFASIFYYTATAAQWINSGIQIENMAFWCALILVAVLTFYWMSATILAMIITTLPGMYPLQALKLSRELISGRRAAVLMRVVVMIIPVALVWLIVVMSAIFIDTSLNISYLPIVPIVTSFLIPITLLWVAIYTYMLYRYVIDDPTPPYSKLPRKKFSWKSIPDMVYNSRTGKFVIRAIDRLKTLNKSNGVKKNS